MPLRFTLSALLVILTLPRALFAQQDAPPATTENAPAAAAAPDMEALYKKFAEKMSGAKLIGNFTVDRALDRLISEEYTIVKAEKIPRGDYWLITARIKYGKNDVTIPMPLEVKWADKTPVITLDEVTIPGLGTFSARVVIHGDRYAGTWQHGDKGGHLFGKIERADMETPAAEEKTSEEKAAAKSADVAPQPKTEEAAPKAPLPAAGSPPAPKSPDAPK
jgi:hypothetical protein